MVNVEAAVVETSLFLPDFTDNLFFHSITCKLGDDGLGLSLQGHLGFDTVALYALLILGSESSGKSRDFFSRFSRKVEMLPPSVSSGIPSIRILSTHARPPGSVSLAYMLTKH